MDNKDHWESIYAGKRDDEMSWTQPEPTLSLALIAEACPSPGSVIDVGGGTSVLAARLLDFGYSVTVLDISEAALARSRGCLGVRATDIRWLLADITTAPEVGRFDVWHDRAVFHFLTAPDDRARYIELLSRALPWGAHAIIATFSLDAPEECSGLPVQRYDATSLAAEVGSGFKLLRSVPETHLTPWGKPQAFQYALFRRF